MIKLKELLSESIENKLKSAAKKIKHCGDYGMLFYNPITKKVHWTSADSDGSDKEHTSGEDIRKMLMLKGIKHVEIGDEWSPDENEGWKRLNYD